MSYGDPYGSPYGGPLGGSETSVPTPGNADENAKAIAFPMQFTERGDVNIVNDEVALNDDVKLAIFIREGGIPLFPFGVGIDDFIFDVLTRSEQIFLTDRIAESVRRGVRTARVDESAVQYDETELESKHKTAVSVPYKNLKTNEDNVALLSVKRQRTDQ